MSPPLSIQLRVERSGGECGGVDSGEHLTQILELGEFDAESRNHRRGNLERPPA